MARHAPGPNVLHQITTAHTRFGHVARCGCGWRAIHNTDTAADQSGNRHLWTTHGVHTPPPDTHGSAA